MNNSLVQNVSALNGLPNTWALHDFEDVVQDQSAGNIKILKSDFLKKGDYAIVDQGKDLIAGYTDNESHLVKAVAPCVVFGDHTRIFKYVDFDFAMGADGTKILKPKRGKELNEKYLYYFFLTLNIPNTGYNRHYKYLKITKIPLPPLAEQQKIAAILDAAESLRQKDQQLIDHYTTLSQSLFLEMFGDPVTNPMGWPMLELVELSDFENGDRSSNYPSGSDIKLKGVLFLSTKNIVSSYLDLGFRQFISEEKYNSLSRGKAKPKDLLITLRGTLGSCCIFEGGYETAFINAQMMIIRCKKELNPVYLHSCITSTKFNLMLQNIGKGAAVPQLTATQLGCLEVNVPPIELQNQFAERIQVIEAQKQQAQTSLKKSNDLFNSLLQKSFKSELTT